MQPNDSGDVPAMARTLSRRSWLSGVWGNPLARGADRWQAGVRMLFIALWMLMLPVAATLGSIVTADGLRTAQNQARDRNPATAVLLADAPKVTFTGNGFPVMRGTEASAGWVAPDGTPRTGTVTAQAGSLAGGKIPIWVDKSGQPVDPPVSSTAAVAIGVGLGVGTWIGWGLLLAALLRMNVVLLDRGRRAEWDREWSRVGPVWLRQE